MDSKKLDEDSACIVSGVAALLSDPEHFIVENSSTRQLRPCVARTLPCSAARTRSA